MSNSIPTRKENPNGLHQRYIVQKANGENVDPNAEYFVLRLDKGGKDPNHLNACKSAVAQYARNIHPFIPELADDLRERYCKDLLAEWPPMVRESPGPYGLLHLGRGSIGDAVRALKDGHKVARKGWATKGLFLFMQVPAEIGEDIIPKMQSLPDSVKSEFATRGGSINYSNQIAQVNPDNSINGWSPSTVDTLADDWELLYYRG